MNANSLVLLQLALQYSNKIAEVTTLLSTANAEGRDTSQAELDGLFNDDDAARASLNAAIAAAEGPGIIGKG